jgi:pimeloyl-ACP methyl ester carboxylesterase
MTARGFTRIALAGLIALAISGFVAVKFWPEPTVIAGKTECWFAYSSYQEVSCHYVAVPAFRDGSSGNELLLPVAVIGSLSRDASATPVVIINGGPGQSAFGSTYPESGDAMAYWFNLLGPILQQRDVILYDQRGVGLAEPSLNCPESERFAEAASQPFGKNTDDGQRELDALVDCALRLQSDGIDFAMLSTPASADDLSDVLKKLGYVQADLWAFSYGTRLALEMMRSHPEKIRSVLLDGVDPRHVNTAEALPRVTAMAFQRLFDDCAASRLCDDRYPNLGSRFVGMVERLNRHPEFVALDDSERWDSSAVARLDGNSVVLGIYDLLYDSRSIPSIPESIDRALGGDLEALTPLLRYTYLADFGMAEGVYLPIWCRERLPFLRLDVLESEIETYGIYGTIWTDLDDNSICEIWDLLPADELELVPVESDIPTLLVSGYYDPVTPPEFAHATAQFLSDSRHLVFRGGGHAVTGSGGCATDLAMHFFENPVPSELVLPDCARYRHPPQFEFGNQ